MKMLRPTVGNWYIEKQSGGLFEVVAWDESTFTIEAQYLDGEIAEYDLDAWREMSLTAAEAPEDWRTAFELDDEDRLDPDLPLHPEDWRNPLHFIEPDIVHGLEEF